MAWEFGAWQTPFWKLPQVPDGVPKLANSIADIDWPSAHCRSTLTTCSILVSPELSVRKFSTVGWCSKASAQTLVVVLFTRDIFDASPPSSSKSTTRFCFGFNHDLGTWYLTNTKFSLSGISKRATLYLLKVSHLWKDAGYIWCIHLS